MMKKQSVAQRKVVQNFTNICSTLPSLSIPFTTATITKILEQKETFSEETKQQLETLAKAAWVDAANNPRINLPDRWVDIMNITSITTC